MWIVSIRFIFLFNLDMNSSIEFYCDWIISFLASVLSVAFPCIQCVSLLRDRVLDSSGRVMRSKWWFKMLLEWNISISPLLSAIDLDFKHQIKTARRRLWIESKTLKRGEENSHSLIELKNGPPAETQFVNYFSAIFKFRKLLAGKQWLKILTSFVWEVPLFTIETPGGFIDAKC